MCHPLSLVRHIIGYFGTSSSVATYQGTSFIEKRLCATTGQMRQGIFATLTLYSPPCFSSSVKFLLQPTGRQVDKLIITNGEGGFRYSILPEPCYNESLTIETIGRKTLPAIRKKEALKCRSDTSRDHLWRFAVLMFACVVHPLQFFVGEGNSFPLVVGRFSSRPLNELC